jgi:hypothetical protein
MHGKEEEHKDLWKYIFYHAKADEMSSQPDEYDEESHQNIFNNFKNFVESPSGMFRGTIIDGNDVINTFSQFLPVLQPSTGYIKEVLDRVKEMQDTGKIDMSFVTMPEGESKQQILNQSKNQAINIIKSMAPDIIQKYSKESKMSKNWFKKIIVSQIVSNDPSTDVLDKDIKKGPNEAKPPYEVGMKVRDRRKGMVNPQEYGKIDSIKNNKMKIIWNPTDKKKKKEEIFDLIEDTSVLAFLVAEV